MTTFDSRLPVLRAAFEVRDLPVPIVFAALYDVSWSPGMGLFAAHHTDGDLDLAEAASFLDALAGDADIAEYRGRLLNISIRDGHWNATGYNLHNADGLPLAQAVVARIRRELHQGCLAAAITATDVGQWARDAFAALDLAKTWRNTALHNPDPPQSFLGRVHDACAQLPARVQRRLDLRTVDNDVRQEYRQLVRTWAAVEALLESEQRHPLDELSSEIRLRTGNTDGSRESVGNGALYGAVADVTQRELESGTCWDDMPGVWEQVLIERAVRRLIRMSSRNGFDIADAR